MTDEQKNPEETTVSEKGTNTDADNSTQKKRKIPASVRLSRRIHTPTMLQMEAVECGAAALGIILGYHGKYVALEELRLECGVSRDGSKAINMLKAARRYGLESEGWRKSFEGTLTLKPPFIVFWKFCHFVVVEGFSRRHVYLNDPATGPVRIGIQEFDDSFTGVVLTFKPGPEFKPSGSPPSLLSQLRQRLEGSEKAVLYAVLAGMALVIPGMITPCFSSIFVDQYLVQGLRYWVVPLLWVMGVTCLIKGFITWLQQYYLMRTEMKLAVATSSQFFWHILRLPVEFFSQRFCGEIGSRVQLNDLVASLLSGQLATTAVNLLVIACYGLLLFCYEWKLALIGIIIASLNLMALKYVSRLRTDGNRRLLQELGKLTGTTMGGLQIIETIKAAGMEDDFFGRFAGLQAKVVNASQSLGALTQLLNKVPVLLSSFNSTAMLCLGAYTVMRGDLTIGGLVAFQALMGAFIGPFSSFVDLGSTVQEATGNMGRLDDVLRAQVDPQMKSEDRAEVVPEKAKLDGYLEIKNLTFGYSRLDKPLIRDFNLSLTPGKRVAIVGGSGSGKSTVVNLVCGLFQPWSGEILFDGKPRSEIPRNVMVNSVSRVSQDIFLFEGTVLDNLTMWDRSIKKEYVVNAARDACIDDVLAARPGGYFSKAAEFGANFSGGQRQRLEIARALAVKPRIVVLDEATSALDPETEFNIDSNLRRRGCTCLIVAHRLSTVRDCDEIIVMSRGSIVERGTHDELMAGKGVYAALIKA